MKDELFGNKVSAAVLTSLLLFFGLPILVKTFNGGGHHGSEHHGETDPDNPLHLTYNIPLNLSGAAVAAEPEVDLATLLSQANAAKGERGSAICKSCHTLDKDGANGTGPNLYGIMGANVAAKDGFGYSSALKEFGGTWTYERMDKYLENSKSYIPGTAMAQKIRKPEKRADTLAFLQTLADAPYPFPQPTTIETLIQESDAEALLEDGSIVETVVETVEEIVEN